MSTEKLLGQTSEKRTLRYDFTAVEIHDLSLQLANKDKEVKSLMQEKKSVTSQFTAKINEAEASRGKLSNQVSDGFEYRDIDCEVVFNQPTPGKKTIIRKDSNTLVSVEAMTTADYDLINEENNLFNQLGDAEPVEDNLLNGEVTEEVA
jgi:hypothetical protein